MDVVAVDEDIINQIPLLGPGVYQCGLVLVCQSEECVSDGKVIFSHTF